MVKIKTEVHCSLQVVVELKKSTGVGDRNVVEVVAAVMMEEVERWKWWVL